MMKELKDRRVIVVGTGKSGIGSAVLLEKNGALPVLYDQNDKTDKEAVKAVLREKLGKETKAEVYTGDFPKALVENAVLTVLSPGVPVDADFVVYIDRKSVV